MTPFLRPIVLALLLIALLPARAADTKISEFPSGAAVQSTDAFVIARAGANFKLTWTQMIAGYLAAANNLSDVANAGTARTNLGLGSMAVEIASNYLPKAGNLAGLGDVGTSRDNLGLGTIATQAASSVAITGGAINGATVGASTPAAGTFTTLTAQTSLALGSSSDLFLVRDAANALGLRNSTSGQLIRIYNTFTDASNYERGDVGWSGNVFFVRPQALGTGTVRNMNVGPAGTGAQLLLTSAGTNHWTLNGNGHFVAAADNATDVGAAGALRPRTGYFGTSLVVGGNSTTVSNSALTQVANNSFMEIGGGPTGSAGNFILYGGTHATRPNQITLRGGSTERWNVDGSGHFMGGTDNTYDIGAAAATRPRNGYFGTSVAAGTSFVAGADQTTLGNGVLSQVTNTTVLQVAGGNNGASGNIVLYGGAHASQANQVTVRAGTAVYVTGKDQHWNASGSTPTMGACGTSPSVVGKDEAMLVTVGTGGSATSCAVTFANTWTNAPVCHAQNDTDRVAYSIVTTTGAVTITATAAFTASSKFHVLCRGYV